MCKDIGIQPSILTDLKMGRQNGLSAKNADKMAAYFAVSVGYLLGTDTKKRPPRRVSARLQWMILPMLLQRVQGPPRRKEKDAS